jgi:osmotically-inducible protein OsmY
MYIADPQAGKRRRARVRDRFAHMKRVATRKLPRAAERRGRFLRGKLEGVRHDVQELAAVGVHRSVPDNETLVARVRSEVMRKAHVSAGEVHVDAYEGCVTLRGQMESEAMIERLVDETRRIEGVGQVRSYLHLPGTLPPNKAQSYQSKTNGAVPAHLAR